jgi:hypothetical protein
VWRTRSRKSTKPEEEGTLRTKQKKKKRSSTGERQLSQNQKEGVAKKNEKQK